MDYVSKSVLSYHNLERNLWSPRSENIKKYYYDTKYVFYLIWYFIKQKIIGNSWVISYSDYNTIQYTFYSLFLTKFWRVLDKLDIYKIVKDKNPLRR